MLTSVSVPTVLYHYTGPGGVKGILESKSLWASNIHYLNDSKELHQAIECAQQVMRTHTERMEVEPRDQFRQRFNDHLERISRVSILVASLSEDGDSLSQWRGYCPSAGGYAVGLDHGSLSTFAAEQGFRLVPCSYDTREHKALVDPLIERALGAEVQKLDDQFADFLQEFVQLAPLMKHGSFSEEREWRLVSGLFSTARSDWHVRAGKRMLIPYTPLSVGSGSASAIRDVVVGPTPNQELAMDSLMCALRKQGVKNCQVRRSDCSYRDW